MSYQNPIPVVVSLVPVITADPWPKSGLLVIRRGDEPAKGELALPGGYLETKDGDWRVGAARELKEELDLDVKPDQYVLFDVLSGREGALLLLFGLVKHGWLVGIKEEELPPFTPNDEVTERLIITGPTKLAFETHTKIVERYFLRP